MELDYRTGQVLDAIKAAGVEDNTIVLWLSDNAAAPTSGPSDTRAGSNGPFRGELGDALEGSIRTIGMIKWPGKIAPRASNEMVSVHDWFPTLAGFIGAKVPSGPAHRRCGPGCVLHRQAGRSPTARACSASSATEVAAVRWRNYRIYPKQFVPSSGNPAMSGLLGIRQEGNGFPTVFNIEADPREENERFWHQRLGDRPVPESDRRVYEDAGEVSQSQAGQPDGVWQVSKPTSPQHQRYSTQEESMKTHLVAAALATHRRRRDERIRISTDARRPTASRPASAR